MNLMLRVISVPFVLAVVCHSVSAEEINTSPQKDQDWLKVERQAYQRMTLRKNGAEMLSALPSVQTFVRAANHNIKKNNHDEYKTIFERNALYDLVSLILEHEPVTKNGVKGVRFFHAATAVTARVPLGIVDTFGDTVCDELTPEVREFLRDVNSELFSSNMPVMKNLLFDWQHPMHPSSGASNKITAWDFDLAMVDFEQSKVEELITKAKLSKLTKENLNTVAAGCNWIGKAALRFHPVSAAEKWVKKVGYEPFDFFKVEHRKALGKALVTLFHQKTEADFKKAIGK